MLLPPILVVFFFGGFALRVGPLLAWLVSANVAWLIVATGVGHYLSYEFPHFAYHARPDSRLARLLGLAVLRRLHTRHHDPTVMAHRNFNIT